jgi:YegS/Rv2252/BmrU family lipid kinase
MKIGVVVNPAAGGGRLAAIWPDIAKAFEHRLKNLSVTFTSKAGNGAALAEQFVQDGAELVIAAGGDGTASQVADGILRSGGTAQLGVIPVGTGRDFVRNFGMGRDEMAAMEAICSGRTRQIDAGRVTFVGDDGQQTIRHFLNVASLGVSGPTVRAVNTAKHGRQVSAKLTFYFHTLRELFRYREQDVRIEFDDGEVIEVRTALVAVANGRHFGGGMMIAPDAALDDGLFDVLVYRPEGKIRMLLDFNLIYKGDHTKLPRVRIKRARSVEVFPAGGLAANAAILDIDGESPGRIGATFEVLPGALTLRV